MDPISHSQFQGRNKLSVTDLTQKKGRSFCEEDKKIPRFLPEDLISLCASRRGIEPLLPE